jgi:ABC-type glutathione transport system ATPase component
MSEEEIIAVDRLRKSFPLRGGGAPFLAVNEVSFTMNEGETLGLVGETGAGKSTIGRCLLGLEPPSAGRIEVFGRQVSSLSTRGWKEVRREMQAVFQDPKGAMNPRWTVADLVGEPLRRLTGISAAEARARVEGNLDAVGLGREYLTRRRHQLSGGQQQRVSIARALAVNPRLLILDEPVSALDSSVKRDIVKLLDALQRERHLAYLLISHDLDVIRILCRRMIVLFRGRIVEMGPVRALMSAPVHPYTRQLLAAQIALPSEGRGSAFRTEPEDDETWSPDGDREPPLIGDLVQVGNDHFAARQAP